MMTDPIADMLTRLRNAIMVQKPEVAMPTSKIREGIATILRDEGYLEGYEVEGEGVRRTLTLAIRYRDRRAVIQGLRRVSKPGGRVYRRADELPRVQGGLGVAILSTSDGLLPDREARRRHIGGEVLCEVW